MADDYTFTESNLVDNKLTVKGAVVGGFALEDPSGQLILAAQKSSLEGVEVDLSGFDTKGNWKVRFFRGEAGKNTSGGISSNDALIYALMFG